MKAKKLSIHLGVLVFGSVITTMIDHFIGISFKDVGLAAPIIHKTIYIVWGGIIFTTNEGS